ncbi:MAG: aromatic amino acid lyase, partial [Chitinophagaceae bacterium]
MSYNYLPLDRQPTNFQQLKNLLAFDQLVSITFDAHERILKCREYLDRKMDDTDALFYGINTGFGYLQNVRIDHDQLEQLQSNLIKSHACGMGEEVPEPIVKLMLALKIKSLSYGHSGVQIATVKRLMDMYNNGVYPVIFTQGSLGASGDLAPLSHLSLPLLGLGEVRHKGIKYPSEVILDELDWQPIQLQSKEGLALINGTQFMTAYGLHNLIQAERLLNWANIISALSFDAFDCVADPLNANIHRVRPHAGQVSVAEKLRCLLHGSEIGKQTKKQVQDPYSFRCIPQVHGATDDTIQY